MSPVAKFILLFASVLVVLPFAAEAQVTLSMPLDGEEISIPPAFEWSGVEYDWFYFISLFHYDLDAWAGYYPHHFWVNEMGFTMPSA